MRDGNSYILFSLKDIKVFFFRNIYSLICFGLICSAITFFNLATETPKYEANAIYHDEEETPASNSGVVSAFFSKAMKSKTNDIQFLMKSSVILKPLVKKMGLQATVSLDNKYQRKFNVIKDNIYAEKGLKLKDLNKFSFVDVEYDGDEGISFYLSFLSKDRFNLLDSKKKILGEYFINERVVYDNVSFTLIKTPSNINLKKTYPLTISPYRGIISGLAKSITIVPNDKARSYIELSYLNRDRYLAADILNNLMKEYRLFLNRKSKNINKEQLSYLRNRQEELQNQFSDSLEEYVCYKKGNIQDQGFLSYEDESKSIMLPLTEYKNKLFELELDEKKIEPSNIISSNLKMILQKRYSDQEIGAIFSDINKLQSQRDFLDLALCKEIKEFHPKKPTKNNLEILSENKNDGLFSLYKKQLTLNDEQINELKQVRGEKKKLENLFGLLKLDSYQDIDGNNFDPFLKSWIQKISVKQKLNQNIEEEKQGFHSLIERKLHLLSFKENLLQQRSLYPSYSKSDFESADLTSIENFLMRYINQIEDSELQKKQYSHIKKQLKKTTFDITSLDITILDSFCSSLINEANALNYKLHDEKNHSIKEKQRIQVELNTQKKFISDHLEEMIGMKDIHISLLSEKIISLQKIKRDRINQNLSSLYNQLTQKKENLRRNLELDIDLIKEKINFFNEKMNVLPVKWKKEKCLEFQQEMNMKIMQSLASMVEAKTIQNNMEKMLSKPFEFSLVPIFPKKPKLLFFMIIYSFIGTFCFFTIKFCFYLIKGQSASEETLAAMNFRVNGSISAACDGNNRDLLADKDLESLRKIISFIEQKKIINPVIGIISNNGPDYSNILASLFSQKGKKVLLINASFQDIHTAKDKVGLLQYLKKEIDVLPIERKDDFDFVPCGGRYRYSVELLGSTIFTSLIDEMRNKYDIIFLFSQSSFKFAQTRIFNQVCDKLIVSFKDESLLEIKNIFNDPSERLSFVAIE